MGSARGCSDGRCKAIPIEARGKLHHQATEDIQQRIAHSSTFARDKRSTFVRYITRRAFAAVAAVVMIVCVTVGYLQWNEARQLATEEDELAAERVSNAALADSLHKRQIDLDHAQANILGELSGARLSRGELDSALRLASHGARIDLALPSVAVKASSAAVELAAAVPQAQWRSVFSGHDDVVNSAALSPDGSRIVTASDDRTARVWDVATAREIVVLRGHED